MSNQLTADIISNDNIAVGNSLNIYDLSKATQTLNLNLSNNNLSNLKVT
ncbi:hypothetical protein IKS57_05300 [bacterium]|nr:hypothetical protein [bacterium]